jgi:hypothetical protein
MFTWARRARFGYKRVYAMPEGPRQHSGRARMNLATGFGAVRKQGSADPPSGPRLLSVPDGKCLCSPQSPHASAAASRRAGRRAGRLEPAAFYTASTRRRARLFDSDRFRWAVYHTLIVHIAKNAMYAPPRIALISSVLAITAVTDLPRWAPN